MMEHLVFGKYTKIGDLIKNIIIPSDVIIFFGGPASDLTLVARIRETD